MGLESAADSSWDEEMTKEKLAQAEEIINAKRQGARVYIFERKYGSSIRKKY